jgi:hypothetical protein
MKMNKTSAYWFLTVLVGSTILFGCTRIRGGGLNPTEVPQSPVQSTVPPQASVLQEETQPAQATNQPQAFPTSKPQAHVEPTQAGEPQVATSQKANEDVNLDVPVDDLEKTLEDLLNQLDSEDKLDDIK